MKKINLDLDGAIAIIDGLLRGIDNAGDIASAVKSARNFQRRYTKALSEGEISRTVVVSPQDSSRYGGDEPVDRDFEMEIIDRLGESGEMQVIVRPTDASADDTLGVTIAVINHPETGTPVPALLIDRCGEWSASIYADNQDMTMIDLPTEHENFVRIGTFGCK